jgi:hypothetical protein
MRVRIREMGGGRGRHRIVTALVLAVCVLGSGAPVAAAPDARELAARQAFASGRYPQALEIFANLYAEKMHPTYLRNIGRCYQNMGEPDKAITSFRDYLRAAKDVTAKERIEVQGFIKEMEDLKREREAEAKAKAAGAAPVATPVAPAVTTATLAVPPPSVSGGGGRAPAGGVLLGTVPAPDNDSPAASPPLYQRWWFWTIVGGVVAAGTATALWKAGAFSKTNEASCPAGWSC